MKIAAVVVTYNRKEMLLETLAGVAQQSRAVDRIFLINNASTDGTSQLLEEKGILEWENLEYHNLPENTGGAGGFSYGMQLAVDEDFDWVWTMDDDVEPDHTALEKLLEYTHISECINSRKIFTENGETQDWEQYFDFTTCRRIDLKNASFQTGKAWCSVNVACFEGMLASRNLIMKIGPPDPDYFTLHDDTVFGIKASFHTNVIYVRDAVFHKKIYSFGAITPLRCYYMVRNSFKLRKEVYATGLVRKPGVYTNLLFFLNLTKASLASLAAPQKFAIAGSLLRGWRDGVKLK